jgi:hypothetical protein
VLFHAVASLNSVAQLVREQACATADASPTNRLVVLLTLGLPC